jgi:hypothetical protein
VAVLLAAAGALVGHMRLFQFVTDDAFIAFVYARNLAQHGQLVFNLGERVEGYTNFLWTVFLAGWMRLGWQPESSSVVFGVAFAIGTMVVCAWLSLRLWGAGRLSTWDALPAVLLAAVPGWACWSAGGLETQMFIFFATLGAALYLAAGDGVSYGSAVAFGLAALTRPEGNLFFALVLLHRSIVMLGARRLLPRRREWAFVGLYLAVVVPHLVWRHHYYGWWLPNTFYIKSSGGAGTWGRGFYYLRRFFEAFLVPLLLVPPAASLLVERPRGASRFYGYALLVVSVFLLYVASVGGDFMGLFRFALPVMPLVAIAASFGVRALCGRLAGGRRAVEAVVVGALLAGYAWHDVTVDRTALARGSDNGIDSPGYLKWYTEDRAAIGRWFGRYARPDDYAAVGGAGAQVYYSGIRSLDCFGLSDAYIAHEVPAVSNRPGHQKYAPLEYQLAKHPTIITSNYYDIGPAPLVRPDAPFWRARGYHYVSVQIPGLSSPWYTFLKRADRAFGPLAAIDNELN